MRVFILRCPRCKNEMKYQSKDSILIKKRKKCVYCGKDFKVSDYIIKRF